MREFHLYHAPWSRRFKTYMLKGAFAYELQIGPLVVQWFYNEWEGKKAHAWLDPYWR